MFYLTAEYQPCTYGMSALLQSICNVPMQTVHSYRVSSVYLCHKFAHCFIPWNQSSSRSLWLCKGTEVAVLQICLDFVHYMVKCEEVLLWGKPGLGQYRNLTVYARRYNNFSVEHLNNSTMNRKFLNVEVWRLVQLLKLVCEVSWIDDKEKMIFKNLNWCQYSAVYLQRNKSNHF